MSYNLPKPQDHDCDKHLATIKAYAKTYALLLEAITILETVKPYVDNDYGQKIIKNFLNKHHESTD